MYELWQISEDETGILPLFLIDKGDFDKLYIKFKENYYTIITDKDGKIIKSNFKHD